MATAPATCPIVWTSEVKPLHQMRSAGAPVTAWCARYVMHTPKGQHHEARGERREDRALAEADARALDPEMSA